MAEATRSTAGGAGTTDRASAHPAVPRRPARQGDDRGPPQRDLPSRGGRERELVAQALRIATGGNGARRGGRLHAARRRQRLVVAGGLLQAPLELLDSLPQGGSDLRNPRSEEHT